MEKKLIQQNIRDLIDTYYTGGCDQYLADAVAPDILGNFLGIQPEQFKHQLITIALPADYGMDKLKNKISNININRRTGTHKTWLSDALMSVEWYSECHPDGGNLHLHILKPSNYQRAKIIRDFSSLFGVAENFIDVKAGIRKSLYNTRKNYILGEKQSQEKQLAVIADKLWRKENNLQDVYYL